MKRRMRLLAPFLLIFAVQLAAAQDLGWRLAGYPLIDRAGVLTNAQAVQLREEVRALNARPFGDLVLLILPTGGETRPEVLAVSAQAQLAEAGLWQGDTLALVLFPAASEVFSFTGPDLQDLARLGGARGLSLELVTRARDVGYASAVRELIDRLPRSFDLASRGSVARSPLPPERPAGAARVLNTRRLAGLAQGALTSGALALLFAVWLGVTPRRPGRLPVLANFVGTVLGRGAR